MLANMNPTIKRILAIVIGIVVGSVVNMIILMIMGVLIPAPKGVDVSSAAAIKANLDKYEFKHFLSPLFAHALGTFAGAFVAAKIFKEDPKFVAIVVGIFFLLGGIMAVYSIGGPTWYILSDLFIAYIPMAWLAYKSLTKR